MSKSLEDNIKKSIQRRETTSIIEIMEDVKIIGKNLKDMKNYLVVKVTRNLHQQGFWNMDICYVLGETVNERLVIQRLEDNHLGIVKKENVRYPEWKAYEF